jgi:hypothetical protein
MVWIVGVSIVVSASEIGRVSAEPVMDRIPSGGGMKCGEPNESREFLK